MASDVALETDAIDTVLAEKVEVVAKGEGTMLSVRWDRMPTPMTTEKTSCQNEGWYVVVWK